MIKMTKTKSLKHFWHKQHANNNWQSHRVFWKPSAAFGKKISDTLDPPKNKPVFYSAMTITSLADREKYFMLTVATWTKFSLSNKCLRNFGSMPKMSTPVLLTSKKSIRTGPVRKVRRVLQQQGVDGRLLLAIKYIDWITTVAVSIGPQQRCCSEYWTPTKCFCEHWTPTKVCTVTTPLHSRVGSITNVIVIECN